MLVSIIITTYNRSVDILERAIISVSKQDYKKYELVVVNDSPHNKDNKNIELIVEKYYGHYIQNEETLGANGARLKGIEASKGEIIAFLDDDDEWVPNKLSRMVPAFYDKKVGLVYCDMFVNKNGNLSVNHLPEYHGEEIIKKLLLNNYIGGFSGPLIRKTSFDKCGGLDNSLLSSQDNDLWRRLALIFEIRHIKEPLIIYYINPISITSSSYKRIKGTAYLLRKYEWLYEKYPKIRKRHINLCVQNFIQAGWYKEALSFYKDFYSKPERICYFYIFPMGIMKKIIKLIINCKFG